MIATEKQTTYMTSLRDQLRSTAVDTAAIDDRAYLSARSAAEQMRTAPWMMEAALKVGIIDWRPYFVEGDEMATRAAIAAMLTEQRARIVALTDDEITAMHKGEISTLIDQTKAWLA
jgi:hypothetical protein